MDETIQPHAHFTTICREIQAERALQDAQWGGAAHDDTHDPASWCDFIEHQIHRAAATVSDRPTWTADDLRLLRQRLIKIAALGIAGVQSIDRELVRRQYPLIEVASDG